MRRSLLYLAGPVSGLTLGQASDWREQVRNHKAMWSRGIRCITPMRGNDHLLQTVTMKDADKSDIKMTQRAIMDRCKFDVNRADAVLVNLIDTQRPSFGTVMEIAWANQLGKPVILAMSEDDIHEHAMIREAATYRTTDLEQAIELAGMTLGII